MQCAESYWITTSTSMLNLLELLKALTDEFGRIFSILRSFKVLAPGLVFPEVFRVRSS